MRPVSSVRAAWAMVVAGFFCCPFLFSASSEPLFGFFAADSEAHSQLEKEFDSYLSRDNIGEWIKKLSARPHHVGSPYGKEVAEFIASQFSSWGYETEIEVFRVLFPTPKFRLLEMVEPGSFRARLEEPDVEEDSTSNQKGAQLPTYNAYSVDGDVTGELVYVNYGVPDDYEVLERHGIGVKGRIVIARYGGSWRGIKPKVAAEKGAIGCILYSDPRDDGYYQGDVYPKGAFRMEHGVQRGSVADMPTFPGDPLTPGMGAVEGVSRLALKDAPTLTEIPVLPVSYADALPLLRALDGAVAPAPWRGGLPITYHLGPGPAKVHLKLEFNWDLVPAYNVIARLEGGERPEQWIIRGNHHDAWVNGAADPVSGLAALMEEARSVSELVRSGWRPRRSVVYAAWDAEEPGLLGSTEWVEQHARELRAKATVYINSDSNGRGFIRMGGSHTLELFINQVARDVQDPQTRVSVWKRRQAQLITGSSVERSGEVRSGKDLRIAALGSGSDYTPFLQHLGVACLNIGFGGENAGGSYHSIFDSYDHYVRFGDPGFHYGLALAQVAGRVVLRLADAAVLPFEFSRFSDTVQGYVDEVVKLTERMRLETEEHNRRIGEGVDRLVADPRQFYVSAAPEEPVPFLNFAPLQNAVKVLQRSAERYSEVFRLLEKSEAELPPEVQERLDVILMKAEQALTRAQGLPRRPWYAHQIYAPGFYTGYGVKTLPGVREAIEQRNWAEAEEQIQIAAEVISGFASQIDRAVETARAAES